MTSDGFEVPLKATEARGKRIAVASGHHLASDIAVQTYANGGNIVDAAIVGAAVLGVVLPYASGIGGDAYLLYFDAATGITHALNGTGAAPSGATLGRFTAGIPVTGVLSATVPGAVALWEDALSLYGTLSLAEALQPAIRLAREGFPVHLGLVENVEEKRSLIIQDAECARLFGGALLPNAPFVQPDLAGTLEAVADGGAELFYRGPLGRRSAETIKAAGGLFAPEDMAAHETMRQSPLRTRFYGNDIITMPPNSVGLELLLQLLKLEQSEVRSLDLDAPNLWTLGVACWRQSVEMTDGVIGDPRDSELPAEKLLCKARGNRLLGAAARDQSCQSGDTTNLVAIDHDGNAVSLVQSVSGPFGSGIVLPGTGILLNNRMRGFDTNPSSVNCVAPGRRPKHSLVPVLAGADGRVFMAIGTPGAAGQPPTLAQVLSRILAHRQDVLSAIQMPRWSIGLSNQLIVEASASSGLIEALLSNDPRLEVFNGRHVRFGSVKAAFLADGYCCAAADYRRVAAAVAK